MARADHLESGGAIRARRNAAQRLGTTKSIDRCLRRRRVSKESKNAAVVSPSSLLEFDCLSVHRSALKSNGRHRTAEAEAESPLFFPRHREPLAPPCPTLVSITPSPTTNHDQMRAGTSCACVVYSKSEKSFYSSGGTQKEGGRMVDEEGTRAAVGRAADGTGKPRLAKHIWFRLALVPSALPMAIARTCFLPPLGLSVSVSLPLSLCACCEES